jgi:hypothetical protein
MDVRMLGVPVIHGHPIELGCEIALGMSHQVARECLEVGELYGIVGRHNETEVMAVALAPICESAVVGFIAIGVEHPAGSAILGDTFAPKVSEMRVQWRALDPVPDNACLDHDAT